MNMSVVQIRIVRMLMRYRVMSMKVRMPFSLWNGFTFVRMAMMPISMLMVMNMLHNDMHMPMFM